MKGELLLMIEILHYLKDPKPWELWYIPYYGYCMIYIINRIIQARKPVDLEASL